MNRISTFTKSIDSITARSLTTRAFWFVAILFVLAIGAACEHQEDIVQTEDVSIHFAVSYPSLDVETELDEKLSSLKDQPIRKALEAYIQPIFYPTVKDIDMSFYDQRKRGERVLHITDVMNSEEKVFRLDLASSDYRYGGVANLSPNPSVSLSNGETEKELTLVQDPGTTDPHRAAIYIFRGRSHVKKDEPSQMFKSALSMVNSAAALILNRDSCEVKNISATYEGFADTFNILDSLYYFDRKTIVNTDFIDLTSYYGSEQDAATKAVWGYDIAWTQWVKTPLMVCGAAFPSRNFGSDVINGKVVIWTIHLFVTLADGSITKNDIYIGQPVQAGKLKIIKGWILKDGSFASTPPLVPQGGSPEPGPEPPTPPTPGEEAVVGVSVMLNWQQGLNYEPEL